MRSARLLILPALPLVLALGACAPAGWFDVVGSVTVPTGADVRFVGLPCDAAEADDAAIDGDYGDIHEGVRVTVTDQSGEMIAEGTLEAGSLVDTGGQTLVCSYPFAIMDVPSTAFYTISVGEGSRGGVQFTKEQMQHGPAVTLP